MCLKSVDAIYLKLKKRLRWWPRVKVWKSVRVYLDHRPERDGDITINSTLYDHDWKRGQNTSNYHRQKREASDRTRDIYYGFHVFLDEEAAREYARYRTADLIIPFIGWRGDLIDAGRSYLNNERQAVFKKLTLRKRDYKKAVKQLESNPRHTF